MFHLIAGGASLGAGPNLDTAFATDGVLGLRNSHLLLTDPFKLIAHYGVGALITRQRLNSPQLAVKVIPQMWPLSVSATIEDLPPIVDLRDRPLALPMNEEITVESSNSGAGPTLTSFGMLLAPGNGYKQPIKQASWLSIRGTFVGAVGTTTSWAVESTITWERDPLAGVYAVIGCEVVAANALFFRLRFPDMQTVYGKPLRPGGLVQNAANLEPWKVQRGEDGGLGEWGRFHTFTPPLVQVYGDAAGGTYELRMQLYYVGEDRNLVFGQQVA